jgi:hypothetical protein
MSHEDETMPAEEKFESNAFNNVAAAELDSSGDDCDVIAAVAFASSSACSAASTAM